MDMSELESQAGYLASTVNADAAEDYARRGWYVLPLHHVTREGKCSCQSQRCSSPAKHPLIRRGLKDATRDESVIRRWWTQWPEANVGIRTGSDSGIVVVDLDTPRAMEELRARGDLPETLTVRTAKGTHLYFESPSERLRPRTALIPGVDLRADDSYVVAPPSVHATGVRYEVVDNRVAVMPMPKWLLELAAATHLLQHGPAQPMKEVPTLGQFKDRFLDGHARANRQKPSGIAAKENIINVHLIPLLGAKRLDAITNEDVQRVKGRLQHRRPKTANNVLGVLSVLLKKAVEWNVISTMPCTIRLLPVPKPTVRFHDFEDYERLVSTAAELDPVASLIVLLGGEAGLRCGEITALEWGDIDLQKRQACIQRSVWKEHVTAPKGGRLRYVPLTNRLTAALKEHRHLRGQRVLCQKHGTPLTTKMVADHVRRSARRAGLASHGVHLLRHTFCSHLAMRGAPARAIQELAGHRDISTTQRYMHLSPAALDAAIRLLDSPAARPGWGSSGEAASQT